MERLIRSTACGAVALERLAQDANGDLLYTFTHPWSDGTTGIWLSAVDMARCPWCQRGSLRISLAITQGEVIQKSLRHLKLAVDPSPMAPARVCQAPFVGSSA